MNANPSPRAKASDWFQTTLQDAISRRHEAEVQAKATAFDFDELVSERDMTYIQILLQVQMHATSVRITAHDPG